MEKQIRSELFKMTAMMLILAGLGIYAHDFVIAGIQAKVALNSTIFGLFGIAAWLAFKPVFDLKNDMLALHALKTDYTRDKRATFDPYRQPATVFQEPRLLGQSYRLITEELSKQNELQISNTTVQSLIHDVDQRINERKSTILYFSGLMVFLGLLGAFMGLMKTVHSVGDLIGGMDMSGGGGEDSFGKLIEGMKGPLNGMSVGFSSSLFGLMTSMVLGALERCMTAAQKALRNEFEHWLSHMAQIETNGTQTNAVAGSGVVAAALREGAQQIQTLRDTIADGVRRGDRTEDALVDMARSVSVLSQTVDRVIDPEPLLRPITAAVADLARNQAVLVEQFQTLHAFAERDRLTIRQTLEELREQARARSRIDAAQLHAQLDRIVELQGEIAVAAPASVTPAAPAPSRGMIARLAAALRPDPEKSALKREQKMLRRELRTLTANHRQSQELFARRLDESVKRLEQGREGDHDAISRMIARNEAYRADLAALVAEIQETAATPPAPGQPGKRDDYMGARRALNSLRERLDVDLDLSDTAGRDGVPGAARRSTGTDGK